MNTHELKTVQPFFDDVARGDKTCEVRKFDRDFKVGDTLILKEYNPESYYHAFSGDRIEVTISYIQTHEQSEAIVPGWCIISFKQESMKRNFILDPDPWNTYP